MNLIGNAIKFTERGEVVIACDMNERGGSGRVELSVRDTGIGLTQEAIARIFEPFTQADETMTRRFGGTGLGLSICRELVSSWMGRSTVESTPGIGSIFRVLLSLEQAAQAAAVGPVASQIPACSFSRHIWHWAKRCGDTVRNSAYSVSSELDVAVSPTPEIKVVIVDGDRYRASPCIRADVPARPS